MTANQPEDTETEVSLAPADDDRADGPVPDVGTVLSLVPMPGAVDKQTPIARPIHPWDANDQETIWDRSQTPRGDRYVPQSTAVEPLPIDSDVPPITHKGCLSHYTEYKCSGCHEWCLEPEDSDHAKSNECRRCNRFSDL
jgi:hypothetical protein